MFLVDRLLDIAKGRSSVITTEVTNAIAHIEKHRQAMEKEAGAAAQTV
jgi:hypothetical protein